MKQELYICKHCGNVISMIRNADIPNMTVVKKRTRSYPAGRIRSGCSFPAGACHSPVDLRWIFLDSYFPR